MDNLPDVKMDPKETAPAGSARKAAKKSGYRPTQQNRSAASEKKLVEAAEMLFARHGYTHTKVSEIIRESGVSTGTFYHRFSDKEGLLVVMMQRFVAQASAMIAKWGQTTGQHETLHALLTSLAEIVFDTITDRLGVYRAMQEVAQTIPDYWQAFGTLGQDLTRHTRAALESHRAEITVADLDAATTHAVQVMLLLIIQTRLGAGIMFPKTRDAFVPIVVQAGLGILQPKET